MHQTPLRRAASPLWLAGLTAIAAVVTIDGSPARTSPRPAPSESARLRAVGLAAGYNLDHADAVAAFKAAIAADPDDPAPHRLLAATIWINALFEQGAVLIDDYLGQARTSVKRTPLRGDVDRAFRDHIARALALAEARVRRNPGDADAHFQVGAAHSFLASYIGTVEGRGLAALRAGRTAYNEHERVLELDAARRTPAWSWACIATACRRCRCTGGSSPAWPGSAAAAIADCGSSRRPRRSRATSRRTPCSRWC